MTPPLAVEALSCGAARAPATENVVRVGPMARIRTVSLEGPVTTKPTVSSLAPMPAVPRAERLMKRAGGLAAVSASYTSMSTTPVPLPAPTTCAVYAPGARLVATAESSEAGGSGNAPVCANAVVSAAVPPQLSLDATTLCVELRTGNWGSARRPVTPKEDRVGPPARTSALSVPEPATTNPMTRELPAAPLNPRTDRLVRRPGTPGGGIVSGVGNEEPAGKPFAATPP